MNGFPSYRIQHPLLVPMKLTIQLDITFSYKIIVIVIVDYQLLLWDIIFDGHVGLIIYDLFVFENFTCAVGRGHRDGCEAYEQLR